MISPQARFLLFCVVAAVTLPACAADLQTAPKEQRLTLTRQTKGAGSATSLVPITASVNDCDNTGKSGDDKNPGPGPIPIQQVARGIIPSTASRAGCGDLGGGTPGDDGGSTASGGGPTGGSAVGGGDFWGPGTGSGGSSGIFGDGSNTGTGGAITSVPSGWSGNEFYDLTYGERQLVYSDVGKWTSRKAQMIQFVQYAYAQSLAITGTTTRIDDTRQNAFQHAIWNAEMARAWGEADAMAWGTAHEDLGRTLTPVEDQKAAMDLHNNYVGRRSANSSGPISGNAAADVINFQSQLCWLLGDGASGSCR